ncbi:MAG: glycoside hydrolase family 13 [Verrucomicrobiales bacterium]
MYQLGSYSPGKPKYSAKNNLRPTNFLCIAPGAQKVSIIGDFNEWNPEANPMSQAPDGGWHATISLTHGHHQYLFVIDGLAYLDPRAQGTSKNEHYEKVSIIPVS